MNILTRAKEELEEKQPLEGEDVFFETREGKKILLTTSQEDGDSEEGFCFGKVEHNDWTYYCMATK